MKLHRRGVIGGGLGLAACGRQPTRAEPVGPLPPLRAVAPCPVGTCVQTGQLADPAFASLLLRQFSQVTPEFEMKMEVILRPDGGLDYSRPDAIAAFTAQHGLRLYCTTLVWYYENPVAFQRLDGTGSPFARAFANYIAATTGRYRGRAVGWDVVNEAVAEDGDGLRSCLWSRNLGQEDYIVRSFELAAQADPDAVLFLNDYNLESLPRKRDTFLRLVERLLKRGVPLKGLGTQSHITIDLPRGAYAGTMRELAQFGLPIHVSELDVSFGRRALDLRSLQDKLAAQADKYAEVADAFLALPERQRFAFTVWGLRDRDSFLRTAQYGANAGDDPLLFDDSGAPKPALAALERAFAGARR